MFELERSGEGVDDTVADGDAMQREKCANVGTAGNSGIFVCVAHSPSVSGTTNAESVHGSASPGFCVRGKRKKGLTT